MQHKIKYLVFNQPLLLLPLLPVIKKITFCHIRVFLNPPTPTHPPKEHKHKTSAELHSHRCLPPFPIFFSCTSDFFDELRHRRPGDTFSHELLSSSLLLTFSLEVSLIDSQPIFQSLFQGSCWVATLLFPSVPPCIPPQVPLHRTFLPCIVRAGCGRQSCEMSRIWRIYPCKKNGRLG